jgi:mutator protein MutT
MSICVAVAVVEHAGCFLVGRRGDDIPLAGYWEFPGGKCRPGEAIDDAAERECLEETGLSVRATGLRLRKTHHYDHGTIELHFVDCELLTDASDEPRSPFRWMPAALFNEHRFPPANDEVIRQLVAEASIRRDSGHLPR